MRGAGELIVTRLEGDEEVGDAEDWEGDGWEERWRVGEDIEASDRLSEQPGSIPISLAWSFVTV